MTRRRITACPTCHAPRTYVDKHDLYACIACDVWLEKVCTPESDPECPFPYAPARPSLVTQEETEQ